MLVKYPRTYHFPFSPGTSSDDKILHDYSSIEGLKDIIVTEKIDGENTTLYSHAIHARSLDSRHHPSRDWVKGLWGGIRHSIPTSMRICGENMYACHSIKY